jgi:pimeloyl-ACP methyl ester carboxylesterase
VVRYRCERRRRRRRLKSAVFFAAGPGLVLLGLAFGHLMFVASRLAWIPVKAARRIRWLLTHRAGVRFRAGNDGYPSCWQPGKEVWAMNMPPPLPREYLVCFTGTRHGRMRSRVIGRASAAPPVAAVMGMAVSDYQLPALAALSWTQAHLLDLPGLAGSDDTPHHLDVPGYAEAVCDWLDASGLPPVVLIGHSSGTQVAAHVAVARPERVAALVLASPTVDPKARSVPRALYYWRQDSRFSMPGLNETHRPEWRRAGARQIVRLVRAHLRDHLEDVVPHLSCPVLVFLGEQDRLCTRRWAQQLTDLAADGRLVTVPGPHTFLWRDPQAWSEPIRQLAADATAVRKASP